MEAMDPRTLMAHARLCRWTLAKGARRSGDAVAIAAYLGLGDAFDRAMAAFADDDADQNERDYDGVRQAVASGRIVAEPGSDAGSPGAQKTVAQSVRMLTVVQPSRSAWSSAWSAPRV